MIILIQLNIVLAIIPHEVFSDTNLYDDDATIVQFDNIAGKKKILEII